MILYMGVEKHFYALYCAEETKIVYFFLPLYTDTYIGKLNYLHSFNQENPSPSVSGMSNARTANEVKMPFY